MTIQKEKAWYLSRTVWMGAVAVAIAVLEVVENGGTWLAAALAGFGVLSVVLRAGTDSKLIK